MDLDIPQIKIVIIGEAKVGKTCILSRFVADSFTEFSGATLGVSFLSKVILIENRPIKLNIWDTAGQERFSALTKLYSRDSQIIVLVYDITEKSSFDKVKAWYHTLELQGFEEKTVFALVGNKEDLRALEEVSIEEANNFAKKIGGIFLKTSAKNNTGIEELFTKTSAEFLKGSQNKNKESFILSKEMKKKRCCKG